MRARLVLAALAMLASGAAFAQTANQERLVTPPPPDLREGSNEWQQEKCRRYTQAWLDVLGKRGKSGLSPDFVTRHDAFTASGCLGARNVCPRSAAEFDVANILVILGMNSRIPSTFFPFSCRIE